MIARALDQANGDNVDRMINALEGGASSARRPADGPPVDHAMIQPMFQIKLGRARTASGSRGLSSVIKGQFVALPAA